MFWRLLIFLVSAVSMAATVAQAHEAQSVKTMKCSYAFMSAPMAEVELGFKTDGTPESSAHITMHGQSHYESVTAEAPATNELIHVWISKENPENKIEMIVYQTRGPQGQSKLVNAKMPMGKEIWGDCVFTPR
jgi:hypothetical protein